MKKIHLFWVLCLTACSTNKPLKPFAALESKVQPYSREFSATHDELWMAAVKAMEVYTITQANREHGFLQTDLEKNKYNPEILAEQMDSRTLASLEESHGVYQSKIILHILKAPNGNKVEIQKILSKFDNSIGLYRNETSDGREENAFLDRVANYLPLTKNTQEKK